MAYYVEHPMFGMELSLDQPSEDAIERGWVGIPLYARAAPPEQPAAAPVTWITEDEVFDLLYENVEPNTSDGIPEIIGYSKFVTALLVRLYPTAPTSNR